MLKGQYTYLWLNLFTLAMPLLLSFDKKVHFYKKWNHVFKAIAFTGAFFIVWDIIFTKIGVWKFNPMFLLGINIANLPLEEWLFFITVPYACVFVYECLICYVKFPTFKPLFSQFGIALAFLFLIIGLIFYNNSYTSTSFIFCGLMLITHIILFKSKHLAAFFVAYFISTVPFLIVNGVLTSNPVVVYNNAENLGIRLFTIPIEDLSYSFLLLLMNVSVLEMSRRWNFAKRAQRIKSFNEN